jgi:beta-N-acetylhexosaminidase
LKHFPSSPFAVFAVSPLKRAGFAVLPLVGVCACAPTTSGAVAPPASVVPVAAEPAAAAAPAAAAPPAPERPAPRRTEPTSHGVPAPSPATLSLREKAAQLVMPWIAGDYWATDAAAMDSALALVREGVGGLIVGVGASPYDIAEKLNLLQQSATVPLLIAADLESGPGGRFRGGTAFPGNMALGATDRDLDAYEVGRVTALEGRAVGIQLDFAPVVDVNNNPANPIINVRSFGEDPQRVARLGGAFIRGLREHGMLSTAKHFPGHGDTRTDSHIALPVITATRAHLDSVELVPFRAAVRAGTDAVMTAHLSLAGLAGPSSPPATLSAFVLDTLLRRELGFRGLIVTDALNMGAIVSRYGAAQAAVLALEAGADILLMPADPRAAIDAVVDAVTRGEIGEARLDSSVSRVFAAKARAGLFQHRLVDIGRIAATVGDAADVALARDISLRSLVLVRDSLGAVPLGVPLRRRVLVLSYGSEAFRDVGAAFVAAVRSTVDTMRTFRLWPASGPASYDSARAAAAGASAVILLAASQPTAWRPDAVTIPEALAQLAEQLASAGSPLIVVSLGSPYVLGQIPHVPAFLAAWSDTDIMEFAVAQALLGLVPITGKLPVSLPPWYAAGSGLERGAGPGTPGPDRARGPSHGGPGAP